MKTAQAHADLGNAIARDHDEPVWIFPYLHAQVVDVPNLEMLSRQVRSAAVEAPSPPGAAS